MDSDKIKQYGISFVIFLVVAAVIIGIAFLIMKETETGYYDNPYCDNNDNPCKNGGTCVSKGNNEYECDCTINWEGKHCESETARGKRNRPCEKDKPCYHKAKCTDIDENEDGDFEDYKCECPEIVGAPGKRWEGKNCNDFPSTIKPSDYDISCFTDVGKSDLQKEYLQQCKDDTKCSLPDDMMMNCEHNCNESLTHTWCNDDGDEKCVDRFDEEEVRGCDALWRDRREEHDLREEERRACNDDPTTKWDYRHHICVDKTPVPPGPSAGPPGPHAGPPGPSSGGGPPGTMSNCNSFQCGPGYLKKSGKGNTVQECCAKKPPNGTNCKFYTESCSKISSLNSNKCEDYCNDTTKCYDRNGPGSPCKGNPGN